MGCILTKSTRFVQIAQIGLDARARHRQTKLAKNQNFGF